MRQLRTQERHTLKAVCDLLDVWQAQGKCLYIRHNPYSPFTDKKTGKVRFRKPRESQKGAADVIMWKLASRAISLEGCSPLGLWCKCFAIETKAPDGKLSPDQKRWKQKAEKMGIRYLTIRSIDEFLREVKP